MKFQKTEITDQETYGIYHSATNKEFRFEFNDPQLALENISYFKNRAQISIPDFSTIKECVKEQAKLAASGSSSIIRKYKNIYRASKKGHLDFHNKCTSSYALGLINPNVFFVILNGVAYDSFDAGNFYWGMAMKYLKVPYPVAKAGSEANAFLWGRIQNAEGEDITWTGDTAADQRAIKRGYDSVK